jgi:hypothetical protein
MTNKNGNNTQQSGKIYTNDDKGLSPASSGTPMPRVKPVAQSNNSPKSTGKK